ncbi:hypothetical protein ACFQZC_08630 [Streptacidiphilus monticola]
MPGRPSANNVPGAGKQIIWTCGAGGQTFTPTATGNAVLPGQTQTVTYDAEGRTATLTTPDGTTTHTSSYLYDADGNLLEETTGGTTVLYLFGGTEQLTKIGTGVTGQRFYTGPDGTIIARSSGGATPAAPSSTNSPTPRTPPSPRSAPPPAPPPSTAAPSTPTATPRQHPNHLA